MTSPVSLTIEDSIATLTIERPQALNALNKEVLTALAQHAKDLQLRSDVSVVILAGSGEKAFVAGADIKEMQGLTAQQAAEFSQLGSHAFSALENLPQVVMARVQGFALGGGLELALAADFIVASSKAQFGLPEVTLGLVPGFAGTQRLTRRIGTAKALEWVATADRFGADEALRLGLVNCVVTPEELQDRTLAMAKKIVKNGPAAVRRAKALVRQGVDMPFPQAAALESAHFGLCFAGAEAQEGMAAFIEKRPAQFPRL